MWFLAPETEKKPRQVRTKQLIWQEFVQCVLIYDLQ